MSIPFGTMVIFLRRLPRLTASAAAAADTAMMRPARPPAALRFDQCRQSGRTRRVRGVRPGCLQDRAKGGPAPGRSHRCRLRRRRRGRRGPRDAGEEIHHRFERRRHRSLSSGAVASRRAGARFRADNQKVIGSRGALRQRSKSQHSFRRGGGLAAADARRASFFV